MEFYAVDLILIGEQKKDQIRYYVQEKTIEKAQCQAQVNAVMDYDWVRTVKIDKAVKL